MNHQITWAQAQELLSPVLWLEHIPESLYEQTGNVAALATAVVLWETQPCYTIDETATFDLTKAVAGLDRLLESLRGVQRQLENAIHPPQVAWCYMPFCGWIGTTREAAWNEGDQEYRCPECGSSEISILTPEEVAEAASYVDETGVLEKLRSALERLGVKAEANHEHA